MLHRFLDFELDLGLFELRSRGEVVATPARVFSFIQYLLEHRDRVVSKSELISAVWKDTVVSEAAIGQVVMLARKALRDEGDSQHVIKTVRGRGFRFTAEVEPAQGAAAASDAAPPPSAAPLTQLLGRQAELEQLSLQLTAAQRGQGGLVLISGEPGIGKTALAAEFATRALALGADVSWGRAWEEAGAPPFWPWMQVLRALAGAAQLAAVRGAMQPYLHELSPLLPELGPSEPPAQARELDGPHGRFRQFDAIARLLRALRSAHARGPTPARVIILDDLHAVDEASVQLLRFLIPELKELGLLVVATFRDLELVPGTALATFVDQSVGDTTRIGLRGIGRTEALTLVERQLGRGVSQREAHTLYEASGGNPLLLGALSQRSEELQASDDGELPRPSAHALPERIVGAVRRHLTQLPCATQDVLATASAFGRHFPLSRVAELHACSEPELLERLEPARRRGIVHESQGGCAQLSFSHGLFCRAVYSELPLTRRLALHRSIAELLEQSEQLPLYELAHHYDRAAASGCQAKALEFARRAADEAKRMMAFETAALLFERAFALAESRPQDPELVHGLLCEAGEAWYMAGELERATASLDRAADLARNAQDADRFARAVVLSLSVTRGAVLHDAKRHLLMRQALAMLPPDDSEARALLLSGSTLGSRSATLEERWRVTNEAVAMARRLGDHVVLQKTLDAQHLALWGAAMPSELLPIATEIVQLSRDSTAESELLLDGLLWQCEDLCQAGDVALALGQCGEYSRMAEELGSPWHRYMALGIQTYYAMVMGELARATELSSQTHLAGVRLRDPLASGFHALRELFFFSHLGFPAAYPSEPPTCVPQDFRVFWLLRAAQSGDTARARRLLHEALSTEHALLQALRRQTLAVLGQVAILLDDRAAIRAVYELLLPSAGLFLNLQACVGLGTAHYHLGVLAQALSESERAAEHLRIAREETQLGPLFYVYVQTAQAESLQARGEAAEAQILLHAAQATAQAWGLEPLITRLGHLLTQ